MSSSAVEPTDLCHNTAPALVNLMIKKTPAQLKYERERNIGEAETPPWDVAQDFPTFEGDFGDGQNDDDW